MLHNVQLVRPYLKGVLKGGAKFLHFADASTVTINFFLTAQVAAHKFYGDQGWVEAQFPNKLRFWSKYVCVYNEIITFSEALQCRGVQSL